MSQARRIVIVAFPAVQCLDVTGPAEVFSGSTSRWPYHLRVYRLAGAGGPDRR